MNYDQTHVSLCAHWEFYYCGLASGRVSVSFPRDEKDQVEETCDTLDYCEQAESGCRLGPGTCCSLWGLAGRGNNGSELLLCALALLNQTIRRSDWILILLGPP